MSSYYYEIATCRVCDQRVEHMGQPFKFVLVIGATCQLLDKRPQEPPQASRVASDDPKLVLVHENHAAEFVSRVSAKIWPPSN